MTENNRRLTFSQRNGLAPIPQPLKLEEIPDNFRTQLYNLIHQFIENEIPSEGGIRRIDRGIYKNTIRSVHDNIFNNPIDEIDDDKYLFSFYKDMLNHAGYNMIFDIIEHIMRVHPRSDFNFFEKFHEMFSKHGLAYTIVDEEWPTIVPAATPEEGETIGQAFEAAKEDKYTAVREHLRKSAEHINANQPADAVRESIHAVESVLRIVTGKKSDFNDALQKLGRYSRIHPALNEAFKKLYAYTSDEQGIRHALVDQSQSPAAMEEAVFMLGACAAFVSYVIRKC